MKTQDKNAPFLLVVKDDIEVFDASGNPLPHDWVGVARETGSNPIAYWQLGQENGERSYKLLRARTYGDALDEVAPLPDYLWQREGKLAREAWNKSCAGHKNPATRALDGYWQMARAVWYSPAGENAFPNNVKMAIQEVADTLRYGYPDDWGFNGALAHFFRVSEKLAQELESADIKQDAGFWYGQWHSYQGSAAQFEALREKAVDGAAGGLITLGEALIVNIDNSPLAHFSTAYKGYLNRINAEIRGYTILASGKGKTGAV